LTQVLLPLLRASDALTHVRVVNVALRDAGFEAIAAFVAHATSVRSFLSSLLIFFFLVFSFLCMCRKVLDWNLGSELGIGCRKWNQGLGIRD
jgi:hypothetical protein